MISMEEMKRFQQDYLRAEEELLSAAGWFWTPGWRKKWRRRRRLPT